MKENQIESCRKNVSRADLIKKRLARCVKKWMRAWSLNTKSFDHGLIP